MHCDQHRNFNFETHPTRNLTRLTPTPRAIADQRAHPVPTSFSGVVPCSMIVLLPSYYLQWFQSTKLSGVPPSPRSDHAAAVHAEWYLLIFRGGSHATCFNDLHVLDLQTMEWSRPKQQGEIPSPQAGHAGIIVEENWFISGGGDNKSGISETAVLNMSMLAWSVVMTVQGRVPLASEGLSLALCSYNGEDILVSFGGYNGPYSNEVHVFKLSNKSTLESKLMETNVPDRISAVNNATNATRDVESQFEAGQEGKIREIVMDNIDSHPKIKKIEETGVHLLAALKAEKEEIESSFNKEKLQALQLEQELTEAESRNTNL